jgi:probable F420-dependent oxidoreductase
MEFGASIFFADYSISPAELAVALEERGIDALWAAEHSHIPASRRTPAPGGGELDKRYYDVMDPFVTLAAAAAATRRLKLGTGVCLVIQRDTIQTAKQVASIDQISGGRFLFGIGGGWNYEEMTNHGTDPARRWSILRERVLAMKEIWTHDEAEFHGKYVSFDRIWQWPKPIQRPHPPIVVGGNGPRTLQRVLEYGDEWGPIIGRGPDLEERMAELARLTEQAGRQPIPITMFSLRSADPKLVEQYQVAGAARFVFGLPAAPADEVLPRLTRCAEVARMFAESVSA